MKLKKSKCCGHCLVQPMTDNWLLVIATLDKPDKQKRCKGYSYWTPAGVEYDCKYNTSLDCSDCKYGFGRKDPEAKCNKEDI